MTFTLSFAAPQEVTNPGEDSVQYSYPFTIVESVFIDKPEERSRTREHRFIIGISRTRLAGWHLDDADLPKILFEFGKRHVISLINSHGLPEDYTIRCATINTASHPESECPFEPSAISSPTGLVLDIEQPKPPIGFNVKGGDSRTA